MLLQTAIRRRISTFALALGFALFGALNIGQIPVDFLPSIRYPLIKLSIEWRGATPEDIDRNLADPIERQIASVDGLDFMSSSALEGLYQLDVNFRYGVDVDVAYQDTLAAYQRALRDLPEAMEPAIIIKADPAQLPVVQIVLESEQLDLTELRTWAENWLADRLISAQGVAAVDISGGLKREIRVLLDPLKLEHYGLTPEWIEKRLREENREQIAGLVTTDRQETIVRLLGEYEDIEDIANTVLQRTANGHLKLSDVAKVTDSHETLRLNTRLNGRPAVKLSIIKQADANTVRTVEAVRAQLAEIESAFPQGVKYSLLENQASYIIDSIQGVRNTALQAALLVMLTFLLFLGSPRQVIVVTSLLPLCALGNFFIMKMSGFSLNIFSLGGLVIAIAVMLDAATVVLENITRLRAEAPDTPLTEIALRGAREVSSAVIASAVAFFALFAPFLFVPGMITLLFRELVIIILSITFISLLGALLWVPMFATVLLRPARAAKKNWNSYFNAYLQNGYTRLMRTVLNHRWITLAVFTGILIGGAVLFKKSGAEFFPAVDDGRLWVKVKVAAGTPLERLDALLNSIEQTVIDDPDVASVFAMSGGAVRGLYVNRVPNEGEVNIELVPRAQRTLSTQEYLAQLRPRIARLTAPDARFMVSQRAMRGIRSLGQSDIEVELSGADTDTLYTQATEIAESLKQQDTLTNVYISMDYSKPEWQVVPDRVRCAELGITQDTLAQALQAYVGGRIATQFREGSDLFDLRLIVPELNLSTKNAIENLPIANRNGSSIRLHEVAEVIRASGPVELIRKNQIKQILVRADLQTGIPLGTGKAVVETTVEAHTLPAGYTYSIGGKAEQMRDMQGVVKQLLGYAVFFSFIVLTVQFNSLRLPWIIYLAAPFALAGMGYGLFLSGQSFGATVIIAIMIVLAANVNDGVLLIETIQEKLATGLALIPAIEAAAIQRMRPRLMTTLPIILGFIPLAFALEEGGELLRPMAAAAIGGLTIEVLAALFLVPVLCSFFIREAVKRNPRPRSCSFKKVTQISTPPIRKSSNL